MSTLLAAWFPQTANTLQWWQWSLLGLIPPAILLLYFLKLRRQPVLIPSTYLWRRTVEDLHVNSIWQRLRQNLLLYLQLLLVGLLMLALLRPFWMTRRLTGNNFVYLVDHSASMNTVESTAGKSNVTRLDRARQEIGQLIDTLQSGDRAMIIAFSDVPRVVQESTDNRRLLKQRLAQLQPTLRSTKLEEAILVASRLANPERSAFDANDEQVADAMPATVVVVSDGKFPDLASNVKLGRGTDVQYREIGSPEVVNLAITAFDSQRGKLNALELQAFARLENFGDTDRTVDVELYLDDRPEPIDIKSVSIPKRGAAGVEFNLRELASGVLRLKLTADDALPQDNVAWATVNKPRKARVALLTPGNPALQLALRTQDMSQSAEVELLAPELVANEEFQKKAADGVYDLIIYDRCAPVVVPEENQPLKKMPRANTWFVDSIPPVGNWSHGPEVPTPVIIDVAGKQHPMMQFVDFGSSVHFLSGKPLNLPPGARSLIDTNAGSMLAIAPREGFEDCVLSLALTQEEAGRSAPATDWITKLTFPVFVHNLVRYFASSQGRGTALGISVRAGQPLLIKAESPLAKLKVRAPDGKESEIVRRPQGGYVFSATDQLGVYEVLEKDQVTQRFAVNLFDPIESDVRSRNGPLQVGANQVASLDQRSLRRTEGWRYLVWFALAVATFEWYVYNRRVYL